MDITRSRTKERYRRCKFVYILWLIIYDDVVFSYVDNDTDIFSASDMLQSLSIYIKIHLFLRRSQNMAKDL